MLVFAFFDIYHLPPIASTTYEVCIGKDSSPMCTDIVRARTIFLIMIFGWAMLKLCQLRWHDNTRFITIDVPVDIHVFGKGLLCPSIRIEPAEAAQPEQPAQPVVERNRFHSSLTDQKEMDSEIRIDVVLNFTEHFDSLKRPLQPVLIWSQLSIEHPICRRLQMLCFYSIFPLVLLSSGQTVIFLVVSILMVVFVVTTVFESYDRRLIRLLMHSPSYVFAQSMVLVQLSLSVYFFAVHYLDMLEMEESVEFCRRAFFLAVSLVASFLMISVDAWVAARSSKIQIIAVELAMYLVMISTYLVTNQQLKWASPTQVLNF
jgi:hypothetical protein